MPSDRLRYVQTFVVAACLLIAARAADAQTVILTKAAPGSNAELLLNDTQIATGTAGADGVVTLQAQPSVLGDRALDARVYVDACDGSRRVIITSGGTPPPSSGACGRTQIEGLFHVQRVSSLVIDVGTTPPTMLLRQGRAPRDWIYPPEGPIAPRDLFGSARTGLSLFAGGGLGTFRDFAIVVCGDLPTCSVDRAPSIGVAGITYWVTRFAGAEATYMRPGNLTASSDSELARFDTEREAGIFTISGIGGVPLGNVRLYGKLGATYHEATLTTNQHTNDQVITVDGNPVLIPGATQTLQMRTGGWGALVGGGGEYWFAGRWGVYVDAGQLTMKGKQLEGGEGDVDDFVRYATVGLRFNIGRIWR